MSVHCSLAASAQANISFCEIPPIRPIGGGGNPTPNVHHPSPATCPCARVTPPPMSPAHANIQVPCPLPVSRSPLAARRPRLLHAVHPLSVAATRYPHARAPQPALFRPLHSIRPLSSVRCLLTRPPLVPAIRHLMYAAALPKTSSPRHPPLAASCSPSSASVECDVCSCPCTPPVLLPAVRCPLPGTPPPTLHAAHCTLPAHSPPPPPDTRCLCYSPPSSRCLRSLPAPRRTPPRIHVLRPTGQVTHSLACGPIFLSIRKLPMAP
ncbi:hypothetical protein GGX14DRAFT_579711 [Mycena pura]|uniref:Uncharacterized protein n=1 Tax=Mycena pura TaxID=153505 RepID=A0AAD6Y423_9AGAR|nr:hypothetical protein GGX14DRAFT_579711 [Mycena pura]